MRRHRKTRKRPIDPYDILAERVSVTARELVHVIHRVNPTRRSVGPMEAAERYRLKAELQSFLIKRFSVMITVEQPDSQQPELVSLKLGPFGQDACHCLVYELDEDARSWVQRQLDEIELDRMKEQE